MKFKKTANNFNALNKININSTQVNQNKKNINLIKNKTISNLINEEINNTSSLVVNDSFSESISGVAENQKTVNKENASLHKSIHDNFNSLKEEINNIAGKTLDEDEFEEINLISDQVANFEEKNLPFSIAENNIYFFKSTTTATNTDFFKNGGFNLVGENVNNISYNVANSNASNYYGFYMNIVSDYDITFAKFAQPTSISNIFSGIERISGYSFENTQLNDRSSTALNESYLNYDFLIIKSKIANNNQTTFNIIKTDKIVFDVALNYFGTLQYLTFVDETNFKMSDSSLLGIWGFKNSHQLNKIAILNDINFSFSETWRNYQFIFVSYYIDNKLSGVLIPTNSITLKNKNIFSIDGRSSFTLENEIEGTFNNIDSKLKDVLIYGFNHIWKNKDSNLNTSKIPTTDSEIEGGENQAEVNEDVQKDLTKIKEGNYNYPQIILNNEVITDWPLRNLENTPSSSEITDDSDIELTSGINPLLVQINKNLENIYLKIDQNVLDGINEIVNQNKLDLTKIKEGNYNYPQLSLGSIAITEWSLEDWIGNTSLVSVTDSSLESISGTLTNQEEVNKENVNAHISIYNDFNNFKVIINNKIGKIPDEEELEEIPLIPEQNASFSSKKLSYPITDCDVCFFWTQGNEVNDHYINNGGLSFIGENINIILRIDSTINTDIYHGIYMNIVSDYIVTFAKFSHETSNRDDYFSGLRKISGYSFGSIQLNDGNNTKLIESYLNYDFLIIKSLVNNQMTFNIIKTDKIVSDVALNYFGTLQYLTFVDETNFTMSDSSLLGIWGFKNNRQLNKIAVVDNTNFSFSEPWTYYQFIFVSYNIKNILCGILVPTNSIKINSGNWITIDGRSGFNLTSELTGNFNDYDETLENIEFYGLNRIWKDWTSDISTSIIPTSDSKQEGGNNQEQINKNSKRELKKIEEGNYNYPQITLNGYTIKSWNLDDSIYSGLVTDNSKVSQNEGINPYLKQVDKNVIDISLKANQNDLNKINIIANQNNLDLITVKDGTYDYPQFTLNGETITKLFLEGDSKDTSFVKTVDSSLESLSGNAKNQMIINKENTNDHIIINKTINNIKERINNTTGKTIDEDIFEEINIISEQTANLTTKKLFYPITNSDIYFLKSSTSSTSTDFIKNAGLSLVGENVNNIIYDNSNSNNSNYFGFYMNIVSDYDVTFTRFAQPSNLKNSFLGIERISAYSFGSVQLNDRNNKKLSESYLNYDFLIIKSQVANNQQTAFNIVKTDKIISNVALNYFGALKYLTFIDETNFTINDSSLLGIWGFKNNRQLNKIATLNGTNFSFLESWKNYQFIFVSYYISDVLAGILIPTNSIVLNNQNRFSIDGRNDFKIINELEGTFSNTNGKLSVVEIYGFNHILKDVFSNLNTSKIPTIDSELEGGENQAEVNENVQNNLIYLEENEAEQSDFCSLNWDIIQNTGDLISIKNGTYDYPQLILNNYLIKTWNDGNLKYSGLINDDTNTNTTDGINPYLIEIQTNYDNIENLNSEITNLNTEIDTLSTELAGIIDGTISIETNPNTSSLIDDSITNPYGGINPYLIKSQKNTDNIANLSTKINTLSTEVEGVIDGTTPVEKISITSVLIDDSNTNTTDGINPYLIQSQLNTEDIENLNTEINNLNKEVEEIINGTTPVEKISFSSLITDNSETNPIEEINFWKTKINANTININAKANQSDLDQINSIVTQNTSDLEKIEDGSYNYPQLILNDEVINDWPSEESITSSSSELIDDSIKNPYEGINPYLIQVQTNTDDLTNLSTEVEVLTTEVEEIIDGTITIAAIANTSKLIDDSVKNPDEGINPYLIQVQTNTDDLTNLSTEIESLNTEITSLDNEITGIIDGTKPLVVTSNSSIIIDDSATNSMDGINPWKTQIDTNTININEKANQSDLDSIETNVINNRAQLILIEGGFYSFPQLVLNGVPITSWYEIGIASISSFITDDSVKNPDDGINPYLIQSKANTEDIETLNTEIDNLNTEVAGIIDGTTIITATSNTSKLIDDSSTNSNDGINPYLIQSQENTEDIVNLNTEVAGIIDGTTVITATSNTSKLIDDSSTNSNDGINPYLIQSQENTEDIETLNTEIDNLNTEVAGIIDGTTVITATSNTSKLIDDSSTNSNDGINPYLIQSKVNTEDIENLNIEVNNLNTQVTEIIDGTIPISIFTSKLIDDSIENESRGMNPYLIQNQSNTDELVKIHNGTYDYNKLTLNNKSIRDWPWLVNSSTLLRINNSFSESISENSNIQKNLNIENTNSHISIHDAIDIFEFKINNLIGKIADEDELEEINLISGQNASLSSRTSSNSITNNNIYFFKSVTSDANINYFKNGGLSSIGENINNSVCTNANDNNSNYYGFFMSIVSDYEIKFEKFSKSLITNNKFQGIERISGYSFENTQLNNGNSTTLSESYSNYDFLIIKSLVNNQQSTFNIIKTDKIISNVALNYFETLQYLTFIDKTNFTISGSSVLGIWGFKNDRQLNEIAILNKSNFSFSETWCNYQFIFVSYYLDDSLGGILIPTNSLIANNKNVFSIDGRSSFTIINELTGAFENVDERLSGVSIYGFNHILKDVSSSLITSKIPALNNAFEGGKNQRKINRDVQKRIKSLEKLLNDKLSLISLNNKDINKTELFSYSEKYSSLYIKNINYKTKKIAKLRVLPTEIDIINQDNKILMPTNNTNPTPKIYVDNISKTKANKTDLKELNIKIEKIKKSVLDDESRVIINLQKKINLLTLMINRLMLPVGSVIISNEVLPKYGKWSLIGNLLNNNELIKDNSISLNLYKRIL